jgi:hypothetical protein
MDVDKVFDVESTTSYRIFRRTILRGGNTGSANSDEFSVGGK